jgi:DNA polymerase alpha subunit B
MAPPADPRIKLTANTDLKKFSYKPMAMNLSEASEVLDDRIDEFLNLVQSAHNLEDSAFGNAASKSTSEIVAVGRIACDTPEGKLNVASLVLETSRRTGAGLRVPLKVDSLSSYEFFPGQIVAVRGINASGSYFAAREVLDVPLLPPAASLPSTLDTINGRVGTTPEDEDSASSALNVIVSSGPYTTDDNLDFEPLHAICEKASETYADALILIGPLFDIEHPLLASGDFDLPDDPSIEPDKATLTDAFRIMVAGPIGRLAQAVPSITIILVPSVRDAVNKHVSWPQEPYGRKELGLPKQAKMVSNPVTISLNEVVIGISAQDILYDLRREEVLVGRPKENNMLARLPRHVIQQRHFYPVFPPVNRTNLPKPGTEERIATGMPLDVSYLKLGEWWNVRPDILVMPSALTPFAKVCFGISTPPSMARLLTGPTGC